MAIVRTACGQTAGVVLGLLIGAVLFIGGFLVANSMNAAGATHAGTSTIHACIGIYTGGQARIMRPGQAPNCNYNELLVELGSGAAAADVEARLSALEAQVPACLAEEDGDAVFTGCDVEIRNGLGQTDSANATGNLIVGYNENMFAFDRTGSHNVVVGTGHGYTNWGGLVAGMNNIISGEFASVSGGAGNEASGSFSSVSGGTTNEAIGTSSSISGGYFNDATGNVASISGGENNLASGGFGSISGGQGNIASGQFSSVSGGSSNTASGEHASVSGGSGSTASGATASVSGGNANNASGFGASISGGEDSDATGTVASVSGGEDNTASGAAASVSGGEGNVADGDWSSVSGGQSHTISADVFANHNHDWIAGSLVEDF